MAINKRYTHLNLSGSNHSQLDAEFAYVTGTLNVGGVATFNSGLSGSLTRLVDGSSYLAAGPNIIITSASNGQVKIEATSATAASYWSETGLNAIQTTGSAGVTSNLTVGGFVTASLGFSGSLTRLTDGSSYIIAGANVTITSASNGAITIAASDVVTPSYWTSDVPNNIFTTGSAVITNSLSVNPAGAGRGLLRVGGLDIGPITGTAQSSAGSPAVLGGFILSASSGVGYEAVVRQEFHIVGFGYESPSLQDVFAATYLVLSHVDYVGVQKVRAVTELSRESSGSFAASWDVNINENCEVTVSGSTAGNPTYWYGQRVKEMSLGGITGRT